MKREKINLNFKFIFKRNKIIINMYESEKKRKNIYFLMYYNIYLKLVFWLYVFDSFEFDKFKLNSIFLCSK